MRPPFSFAALRLLARVALVASPALLTACADDAQFTVKYASGYPRAGETVSVLGVFKDGRLDPEAWDEMAGKVSPVFAAPMCPIGYDAKLEAANHSVAAAIDDYARADGVTDDLLEQLAPAADGDIILVFSIAGRPPVHNPNGQVNTPAQASAPIAASRNAGRRGGMTQQGAGVMARNHIDRNAYEIAATFYSVKDHRSVGLVHMGYIGQSASDALARFVEKLRAAAPAAACKPWRWEAKIDDAKIRQLKDE